MVVRLWSCPVENPLLSHLCARRSVSFHIATSCCVKMSSSSKVAAASAKAAASAVGSTSSTASKAFVKQRGTRMPRQTQKVGIFGRLNAWWAGAENAEIYARYGDRSGFAHHAAQYKGAIISMACVFGAVAARAHNKRARESLVNSEMNRQRFYKHDFEPEYIPNAPEGLYRGAVGYQYADNATPLQVNADNQITAPNRDELRQRMESNPPPISPEMLRAAKSLREAHVADQR